MKLGKKYLWIGLFVSICSALLALMIYFVTISGTYKIQLENNYRRAFYELSNNLQSIELNLSKLVATNNISTQRTILNEIYQIANTANGNLSVLPISNSKISNVNKYLNTLGGYSFSLLEKVNNGSKLDEADFNNVVWLHRDAKIATFDVSNYLQNRVSGKLIIDDVNYSSEYTSTYDAGLTNVNSATSTMPTLIYDGPFSDSVINRKIKGISGDIISADNALMILQDIFGYFDDYSYEYVGDTDGKFATYNYKLTAANYSLYVQITKIGGFVLSVNNLDEVYFEPKLDNTSALVLAENYLKLIGFNDLKCVWVQDMNNVVYFNFAYSIDDIVYYSDLIKIKVDKGLQKVTGMDASNYAYNHTTRGEFVSKLSIEEAETLLSPVLDVVNIQKCVIPNKWTGESDAYEFECKWNEYTYFVYLSSINGDELNIVRIVDTTSGELVQ